MRFENWLMRGVKADVTLIAVTIPLREEIVKRWTSTGICRMRRLPVSTMKALAALRRTDVLLQISLSEGFPNILLEAMALGCAVIATPVGAVAEAVGADGGCAFIIPAGDASMLADRMAPSCRRSRLARPHGCRRPARESSSVSPSKR